MHITIIPAEIAAAIAPLALTAAILAPAAGATTLPGHAMAAAHATAAALGPEGDHAVGSPGVLSGD